SQCLLTTAAISTFASVVSKNQLSKIIGPSEVGKIFALISMVESVIPFFGSFVFTRIFSATVSSYPGTVYQSCAAFTLVTLVLAIVQEIRYAAPASTLPPDEVRSCPPPAQTRRCDHSSESSI